MGGKGLRVSADQQFKLRMPVKGSAKAIALKSMDSGENPVVNDKLRITKNQKFVEFLLPALKDVVLQLGYI